MKLCLHLVDKWCPTLSPFATCGDRNFKCGNRQLFSNRFVMLNKPNLSQILQFIIQSGNSKDFVATFVAAERIWLVTTAVDIFLISWLRVYLEWKDLKDLRFCFDLFCLQLLIILKWYIFPKNNNSELQYSKVVLVTFLSKEFKSNPEKILFS